MQGFPTPTRSDMAESMIGINRLASEIDKRKLLFLHKILTLSPGAVTKELFLRKYVSYITDRSSVSLGFVPDICDILIKYNLQSLMNNFVNNSQVLPSKPVWKTLVKTTIK